MTQKVFFTHRLGKQWKVQTGYVILSHSSSSSGLNKWSAGRSGREYQFDFIGVLPEVIECSSLQKDVVTCQKNRKT